MGAEQPAMGETSRCGTRYVSSSAEALVSVSVCDTSDDTSGVARGATMRRGNVAVEYGGADARIRRRIERALNALAG